MRPRAFVYVLAPAILFAFACSKKKDDAPLTPPEACAKLLTFRDGGTTTSAEKDRCLLEYGAMDAKVKPCTDDCVRKSSNQEEFKSCQNDCSGAVVPAYILCSKISHDRAPFEACMKKHEGLGVAQPDLYRCWAKCATKASDAAGVTACDAACKIP